MARLPQLLQRWPPCGPQWIDCADVSRITLAELHEGTDGPYDACEEILFLDTENMPVDHGMGLLEAAEWSECFEKAGADQWPAVCAWVQSGCYIAEGVGNIPSPSDFDDAYQGRWDSFREYAEQLEDDIGLTNDCPEEA